MATSESDDFESADEELGQNAVSKTDVNDSRWAGMSSVVDSESDDDTECIPQLPRNNKIVCEKPRFRSFQRDMATSEKKLDTPNTTSVEEAEMKNEKDMVACEKNKEPVSPSNTDIKTTETTNSMLEASVTNQENVPSTTGQNLKKATTNPKEERQSRTRRSTDGPRKLGARKLGTKIEKNITNPTDTTENIKEDMPLRRAVSEGSTRGIDIESSKPFNPDLLEADMPEELKSDKKFKEIFKPQGWEKLGNDIELGNDLTEQKIQPVLDKLSLENKESDNFIWGSWSNWGVSSLINTASAGVSTLTTHVSQGLSLLEETINVPNSSESQDTRNEKEEEVVTPDKETKETISYQPQGSFGFGSFLSGVSSITKLVETGSKVMTGGLDTLEAIGKKTMEVLQEGDPGLKKKRAFFLNEGDKPNLSKILREAKEKAESEEKTIEEKQLARKIHFESLFDDFQGLVHLEALEMLSKQCNMKIQGHLINLDTDELMSLQETLEEVKELCDLGDENEENEEQENKRDLKSRLADACQDLGITITYEKLDDVWNETKSYLASPISHTNLEVFQCAISTIAKFTALCVERFHKTAELLLIKERRNTVSEADALVQLTRILTNEISSLATSFCNTLNDFIKVSDNADSISANITTVFLEAANASSWCSLNE
ncbi:hypothetical protein KPH14_002941 [Odynerus spinipes]|uniref:Protein FAM114A2 n=1 Tax=Odynerus spinipes TaxID=1348599 RepID=A0AAD9RWH6_9HYME|nr:hypothetical protein KPH14_002941 [Odynerus spinipes]